MLFRITLIVALSICALPATAVGASIYDEDLSAHAGELRALMVQAEQHQRLDAQRIIALESSLFELQKKLNRLAEEASSANLALRQSGQPTNRDLVFAAAIAEALNLARAHTQAYLDTNDEAFRSSAVSAARLARDLMAAQ